VAIVGSAPSTRALAPCHGPGWDVWCVGTAAELARWDRFFELHDLDTFDAREYADYFAWLARQTKPVYVARLDPRVPAGVVYPKELVLERFGPYFFTSSVAWMMALAIHERAAAIGLFGVDMADASEYREQKAGCRHFIAVAQHFGIPVVVPDGSDLKHAPQPYPFVLETPLAKKLRARRKELEARREKALQAARLHRDEAQKFETDAAFLGGALDDLDYLQKNWT
jgi:hypothetical protein